MYIPSHFQWQNESEIIAFIQQYPFATLISTDDKGHIMATHIPFLLEKRGDKMFLLTHFAKANPQNIQLHTNEVLVIFQEPHAFVSPMWYDKKQNVPTWNYMAVHVYGRVNLLEGDENQLALLEKLMQTFDPTYLEERWRTLSPTYIDGLLRGITAFEIAVSRIEAKEKLNQNKTAADRKGVIEELKASEDGSARKIAERMEEKYDYKE